MDTTLMPWFTGVIVLLAVLIVYLLVRAVARRNRPRRSESGDHERLG